MEPAAPCPSTVMSAVDILEQWLALVPPHLAQGVRDGSQYEHILENIERKEAERARERWIQENPLEYQRQLEQQARDVTCGMKYSVAGSKRLQDAGL